MSCLRYTYGVLLEDITYCRFAGGCRLASVLVEDLDWRRLRHWELLLVMKGLKKQREAWRCVVRRAYRVLLSELFPCGGKDEGKTTDSRVA